MPSPGAGGEGLGRGTAAAQSVRVAFRRIATVLFCLLSVGRSAHAQFAPVDPNGMLLAQNNAAIEQSRLYREAMPPVSSTVDAHGTSLPAADTTGSEDDSFGAQQILKQQERRPTIAVSGGASLVYTSNVALTRNNPRNDVFAVADAGVTWTPRLSRTVEANVGAHASIFRYSRTSALDFQNLGIGVGLAWTPATLRGVSVFGRYDLTYLTARGGDHILTDHVFSAGAQKVFVFGRSHALTVGVSGNAGLSDPSTAQRHQLGAFASYHLQLTRDLGADFLWRPAVHFYDDADRSDFNNILSASFRYRLTTYAELNAFVTYGANRSEDAAFDYDVFTTGVGASVTVRF